MNLKFPTFLLDLSTVPLSVHPSSPPSPPPTSTETSTMWNKLSGAFGRSRSSVEQENLETTRIDVMSSVYEQHPNLSVFHTEDQLTPLPSSANSSQSISRKTKTLFRRTSNDFDAENDRSSSPFSLPSFSKKVKSTLQVKTSRRWSPLNTATLCSQGTFQLPKSH